jgi:hypothetical protein
MGQRRRSGPRLASQQVSRFLPVARVSGLLLVLTTLGVACIYGTTPYFPVSRQVRGIILLVWFWNVCVFAVCGGMVLWGWLVDRFGDRHSGGPS